MHEHRGGIATASTTATAVVTSLPPPGPTSYVIVTVGISTINNPVTGITAGTGTFVKAASMSSASRSGEIWVGYNFGNSYPISLTVTRTAGTASMIVTTRTIDVFSATNVAPAFTISAGNTGTSATADSNTLTPTVGDIIVAAVVLANTSAGSTTRVSSGNTYLSPYGSNGTSVRSESSYAEASTAVSSKLQWSLAAVSEWAAIQVSFTPPPPGPAEGAVIVKGLLTATLDASSAF